MFWKQDKVSRNPPKGNPMSNASKPKLLKVFVIGMQRLSKSASTEQSHGANEKREQSMSDKDPQKVRPDLYKGPQKARPDFVEGYHAGVKDLSQERDMYRGLWKEFLDGTDWVQQDYTADRLEVFAGPLGKHRTTVIKEVVNTLRARVKELDERLAESQESLQRVIDENAQLNYRNKVMLNGRYEEKRLLMNCNEMQAKTIKSLQRQLEHAQKRAVNAGTTDSMAQRLTPEMVQKVAEAIGNIQPNVVWPRKPWTPK
jgi:hypothetical protein